MKYLHVVVALALTVTLAVLMVVLLKRDYMYFAYSCFLGSLCGLGYLGFQIPIPSVTREPK